MVISVSEASAPNDKSGMILSTTSVLLEPNSTQPYSPVEEELFCKLILYTEISTSRIRAWDVIILAPNLLFLLFLILRFNRARLKLRATSSPIFFAFYGLVLVNVVISVIRCGVSMSVNAAAVVGGYVDTILWITVRFFLLSTEMSVVIFGLAFGHLDSRSSIRYVLLTTSLLSLAFSSSQGALEILYPDESFRIHSKDFSLFGHGGMLFWFISSVVFSVIYITILILPWTRLRERLNLPIKKSFYFYVLFLAFLNICQSVGSGLLYYRVNEGLCVVDVTTCIYFTLFTPLVYHTFLSEFFGVSQPSIMFSYKAQVDDTMEDDNVSLPHQQSFSSLKTDSDYIYQDLDYDYGRGCHESKSMQDISSGSESKSHKSNSVYDSTQLDTVIPASGHTLYNASLQSPDSITGYSLDSQTIDLPSARQ